MNGLPEKEKKKNLIRNKLLSTLGIINVKGMKINFLQFDFVMVQKTETIWPRLKIN